jgi:hypothetical protein
LYADLIKGGLLLGVVAIGAIIALWNKILDWSRASLLPWLQRNLPTIEDAVRDAFIWVDKYVAVPTRLLVKKAWGNLRNYLLKTVAQFERRTSSQWVRRVTSFVIVKLEQSKPVVKKVEIEHEVDWDDLPPEVKQSWMKNAGQAFELDVTGTRDQQLEELSMTN